jgi:D-alanyl-D-alanine endopeptidase (penicillin-binding protein 7)
MFKKFIIAAMTLIASAESYSINLQAKSWLIADADGKILDQQNVDIVQPIASITKLMTVMVVLDSDPNLQYEVKNFRGLSVTRQQLIDLAIIHSDNKAADLLCKLYPTGYLSCIDAMNIKAHQLGMYQTIFADSTGLDNRNISSPKDLIKLLQAAEKYSVIVNASNRSSIELMKKKKRKFVKWRFNNTNPLVSKYNVIVSKTGYVRASGGCLVMSAYVNGKKKMFIVLNSKTTRTRIHDMESLIASVLSEKN